MPIKSLGKEESSPLIGNLQNGRIMFFNTVLCNLIYKKDLWNAKQNTKL